MFKESLHEKKWQEGYGVVQHEHETVKRVRCLVKKLEIDKDKFYELLIAADKLANAAMWLSVHQAYAKNVYLSGKPMEMEDFKKDPQGHLGSSLNMVPAYVGYIVSNAITNITRGWVMEQGHAVSAIDSVNLLLGNMRKIHDERYSVTDEGLSLFARDFYSYKIGKDGKQSSPLGSHVNTNTAGGVMEGGYLGFASLQYVHMPLKDERLVAFLSDGAFEEQKGADWVPRWWRAEDTGLVAPIMIANGRRIDQRSTMDQEGGPEWFAKYLELHDFEPVIFDGRDPAAFVWTIIEQELSLQKNAAKIKDLSRYKIKIPYGIAVAPKGAGFYNEGTNYAHNLPLVTNPYSDNVAATRFNKHIKQLHVPKDELLKAADIINNHAESGRVVERENPIAKRDVKIKKAPKIKWKTAPKEPMNIDKWQKQSAMDAIDIAYVETVRANPHLRPRVGNPDEMLSNKMDDTLDELLFRVVEAEGGAKESTLGNVITALNEEAVSAAAFGNKAGLNIVVTYEAFGAKMFGQARQEVIFSKHCKDMGRDPKWLSVPMVMTSNTWENSKNELSHQDPSFAESMMGEASDISRVVFPADYNMALAVIKNVYKTHAQIWTVVAPKQDTACLFSRAEAEEILQNGGACIDWAGHNRTKAKTAIVAVGAYQLCEAVKASAILKGQGVDHMVSYVAEPGRFRNSRNPNEKAHLAEKSVQKSVVPARIDNVVLMTHTRPEVLQGMMSELLQGKKVKALGFINEGGTLSVDGMLQVNKCSAKDVVKICKGF